MRALRRVVAAAGLSLLIANACAEPNAPAGLPSDAAAAAWPTFVLARYDALRPPAPLPEGSAQATAELNDVVAFQHAASVSDSVIRLHDGDPTALWTQTAIDRLTFYWALLPDIRIATPARSARLMALLHIAMHDAAVATWDAKFAYKRRAPSRVSSDVRTIVPVGDLPSYPSEHAAIAAAAYEVLASAFLPGDTARLRAIMREAGDARIAAGAAYPSDVSAGYALGTAVARQVLAYAATDGSDRVWDQVVPPGVDMWRPTPPRRVAIPFDPMAGTWRPWVIPSGSAFRPAPYPNPGSFEFQVSVDELRRLGTGALTSQQADRARYWATDAPSANWDLFVQKELDRRRWSVPNSARARAWVSIAMYDAFVACWDAKFHYWLARPVTVDSSLSTVFSTPPFPSYPSGHSTISAAAAEVLDALFPDKAKTWNDLAVEASNSRVWGGVHYRFDIDAGETLGKAVGEAVVARMRALGAR